MGFCHKCKCYYCENLGTKSCPVSRICSTCYKGANTRAYIITHCDKQKVYRPFVPVFDDPKKNKKRRKGSTKQKGVRKTKYTKERKR